MILLTFAHKQEAKAFLCECPKFDPSVPLLDEVFKPDEPLDAEEPLYVAAKAAIPAGFPPDTEADVLPCDFAVSVRLKTPKEN